ncbi:MAG: serine hydrolase, partial [Gemmatimonadales bacterium]
MTIRTYRRFRWAAAAALLLAAAPLHAQAPRAKRDAALEKELAGLAAEVRGTVGIYVRHLKTGRT